VVAHAAPGTERLSVSHLDTSQLPIYCAHEHWGSLTPFGTFPGGFTADIIPGSLPARRVGLLDVVLDPYYSGVLYGAGIRPSDLLPDNGSQPEGAALAIVWERFLAAAGNTLLTGTFQCIRLGIRALYGVDVLHAGTNELLAADEAITERYRDPFTWYRQAMDVLHIAALVRPVHPEFYYSDLGAPPAAAEAALMRTVMRIDPLLDCWEHDSPRRKCLVELTNIEAGDAAGWRKLLEALFSRAAERGALGIKQLQAYSRSLDFEMVDDAAVRFHGGLTDVEVTRFQDWMVHECCKLAEALGWPHQVHVGTHNLPHSNPLPLAGLARTYPRMPIVQMHCWPYLREAGWLARHYPSIYIDSCWMPILNPAYFREALAGWVNYIPFDKLMCSQDATSLEMAAGSIEMVRYISQQVLAQQASDLAVDAGLLQHTAESWLAGNATRLYGTPNKE